MSAPQGTVRPSAVVSFRVEIEAPVAEPFAQGRGLTVIRARDARTVRRTTRIHVRPLPASACGSSLAISPRC